MAHDDIFARPPRSARRQQAPIVPKTLACTVCGMRADVLICRECSTDPAASLARVEQWMTGLGNDPASQAERERLGKAVKLLRQL